MSSKKQNSAAANERASQTEGAIPNKAMAEAQTSPQEKPIQEFPGNGNNRGRRVTPLSALATK